MSMRLSLLLTPKALFLTTAVLSFEGLWMDNIMGSWMGNENVARVDSGVQNSSVWTLCWILRAPGRVMTLCSSRVLLMMTTGELVSCALFFYCDLI